MGLLDENYPIGAIFSGIADRFRVRRQLPGLAPSDRLDGRLALVTGGASGLGFATSVDLARRGARVLLVDVRDLDHAERRTRSLGLAPGRVEALHSDLSDLDSIDRLVTKLAHRGVRIDRLVLNAAIVPTSARSTRQGLDEMFVVNYLSSFALVTRMLGEGLLPCDRAGSEVPRVVFVASEAHRWSEDLTLDAVDHPRDGSPRRVLAWYSTYKLMLATFAWELARRFCPTGAPQLGVFALCPGAMRTDIARELPVPLRLPLDALMRVLFQDPFAADEPVLYLACSRALAGRTAVYLHKMTPKDVDPRAADPDMGRRLWERSEAVLARARGR
ncbi:MAG TPA: SDR family NAD(P)-dependent oxidoreductase [Anaeromyxobacteraceae bacterium]|nr:SDR family NAD(P)-dependent oxidoreductase [Anaeromyxobacteraceae bacterium]